VRMRLNPEDHHQFENFTSGGIYLDFQQGQPQSISGEMISLATTTFSAIFPGLRGGAGGAKSGAKSGPGGSAAAAPKSKAAAPAAAPPELRRRPPPSRCRRPSSRSRSRCRRTG